MGVGVGGVGVGEERGEEEKSGFLWGEFNLGSGAGKDSLFVRIFCGVQECTSCAILQEDFAHLHALSCHTFEHVKAELEQRKCF